MAKCLLTRLDGAIENDSIPKIDELMIDYVVQENSDAESYLAFNYAGYKNDSTILTTIRLSGDNYFTDSTGTANYGKIINKQLQTTYVYVYIKYNIPTKIFINLTNQIYVFGCLNSKVDPNKFNYMYSIHMLNASYIDLQYINNLNLDRITLGKYVTGDIKNISNMLSLTIIGSDYSDGNHNIYGDISTMSSMTILNDFRIKGSNGVLYGDLSVLTKKLQFLSLLNTPNASLSWETERPSDAYIIAMEYVKFGDYVDAMLINQAKCTPREDIDTCDRWFKDINVYGNRTSASDSAVATLKEKGYTVSVNGTAL